MKPTKFKMKDQENGIKVEYLFSEADAPDLIKLRGIDTVIVPAQEALPEATPTMETLDGLADGIMDLAEKFKQAYIKAKGALPEEKEDTNEDSVNKD